MATKTLTENINQAISDLNSVKQALIDKGVEIPSGTKTSEYGAKISEIQSGGGGESEKGFVPTETNADGFPTKGILKGMTTVPDRYFCGQGNDLSYHFTSMKDIAFEKPITTIGASGFYYCKALALKSLPDTITTIGKSAFSGCNSLVLAYLPSNLTTIEYAAFSQCSKLALTSLPDGLTSIGDKAFYYCSKLTTLSIGSAITSIGTNVFQYSGLTSLTINKPEGSISGSPWGATKATIYWTG